LEPREQINGIVAKNDRQPADPRAAFGPRFLVGH